MGMDREICADNSGLTQNTSSISTINDSLFKVTGSLTRENLPSAQYKQVMPDGTIFAMGLYTVYIEPKNEEGKLYQQQITIPIQNNIFTSDGIFFFTQTQLEGGYAANYVIARYDKTQIMGYVYVNMPNIKKI